MTILKLIAIVSLPSLAAAQPTMGPTDMLPCQDPIEIVEPTPLCGFNDIGAYIPGRFQAFYANSGTGCVEQGRILLGCFPA
jgi:hypothetical protein